MSAGEGIGQFGTVWTIWPLATSAVLGYNERYHVLSSQGLCLSSRSRQGQCDGVVCCLWLRLLHLLSNGIPWCCNVQDEVWSVYLIFTNLNLFFRVNLITHWDHTNTHLMFLSQCLSSQWLTINVKYLNAILKSEAHPITRLNVRQWAAEGRT